MRSPLDQADILFLNELHRLEAGSVPDLVEALGVTATAIRQRLSRLLGAACVSRQLVRAGRGRPHFEYTVTSKGLRQLGDNYADLALILWREIRHIPDEEIRKGIMARVGAAMAALYGPVEGRNLPERVNRLKQALTDRGYDVELSGSQSLPVLRENNCPYHELADEDRGICEMEQDVFQRVLGAEVKLTQCCLDGHKCCEFEVLTGEGPASG